MKSNLFKKIAHGRSKPVKILDKSLMRYPKWNFIKVAIQENCSVVVSIRYFSMSVGMCILKEQYFTSFPFFLTYPCLVFSVLTLTRVSVTLSGVSPLEDSSRGRRSTGSTRPWSRDASPAPAYEKDNCK